MIEEGEGIDAFDKYYKILSVKTPFPAMKITNENLFRARKDEGKIIDNISQIRYPPVEFAVKGRLNDKGESMTYLSTSQIGTLAEINVGYYEVYCTANIQYLKKDIVFHIVGIKKEKIKITPKIDNAVFSLYRDLITSKKQKVYNATIALARHLFSSNRFRSGILYSSVHEDKTNQNIFNLAIKPADFDECCRITSLEYNILRFSPSNKNIIIDTINNGKPMENGNIEWELSYADMIEQTNKKIHGEIFKENNEIIHYKFGGGKIEIETTESYFVRFFQSNEIREIYKSEVKSFNLNLKLMNTQPDR